MGNSILGRFGSNIPRSPPCCYAGSDPSTVAVPAQACPGSLLEEGNSRRRQYQPLTTPSLLCQSSFEATPAFCARTDARGAEASLGEEGGLVQASAATSHPHPLGLSTLRHNRLFWDLKSCPSLAVGRLLPALKRGSCKSKIIWCFCYVYVHRAFVQLFTYGNSDCAALYLRVPLPPQKKELPWPAGMHHATDTILVVAGCLHSTDGR